MGDAQDMHHIALTPKQPPGGFDSTPVPYAPPGYTLKFTFHRASNLPIADISTLSADPFVVACLTADLPRRHKQDPDLIFRTPTVRRDVNPIWECEWIVANVPASGFELKCRLYDEDPVDRDDRLGNVKISVSSISDKWTGITNQSYRVRKRMGSKRAYAFKSIVAACFDEQHLNANLFLSVECLGKTPGNEGSRMYTIGPNFWSKHFSPLIGRIAGTKDSAPSQDGKKPVTRYNFQAVQIQLKGPVPSSLYHRYVEFKPFVEGMFTSQSIRGRILNHALHHQHVQIYNFDRSTVYGLFPAPSHQLTQQFLEFVHYDMGGRVFTYVITLDGQWRFTETGKEFGIDMLSKHTMHSNVSIYVAYAGEFLVRRQNQKRHSRSSRRRSAEDSIQRDASPACSEAAVPISTDPTEYELVIDNDSGTYRPNAKCLPELKEFLSANLPDLQVTTLDCQEDAERLAQLKSEQRDRKVRSGRRMAFIQRTSSLSSLSSISSSDEEDLDEYWRQTSGADGEPATPMRRLRRIGSPKKQLMSWAESGNVKLVGAGRG
ncbi:hypothetical protein AJ79_00191 [Helicocarpus griseus UAMH5409]|uniref:C2 domain-containing protein n=1 Tax=Helicocarpus griseus UAMH5409 TaxID=1447875 RepID=A0A2B7YCZ4_9EURO|nr:hypothetical protein AJ79_00191 [Helicocarpus griseus UAMH5409]